MKNIIYFILALSLLSCASSKMIEYNGVKMPVGEVAKLRYAEAEKLYQYKKYSEAQREFKVIAEQFKSSNYADNALWRSAQIFEKQKNPDMAYKTLKKLVETYPKSDLKYKAFYKAGRYALISSDELLALTYFSKVPLSSVELSQRRALSKNIETLANKNSDYASLTSWYVLNFYNPNSAQNYRTSLQKKIILSIEKVQSVEQIKNIQVPPQQNFPKGYLAFQKARIFLDQENNEEKSKRAFNEFILNHPNHALVGKANNYLRSFGNGEQMAGSSSDVIYIGLLVPITGPKAHIGQQITKGVILAQDIYQNRYPSAPRIKLLIQDTQGNPAQTKIAFTKLMQSQNKPSLIIGPCQYDTTESIHELSNEYRIPVFSMSSSEKVNLDNNWMFRNSLTKSEQAFGLAYLSKHILKLKRVAILYPESNYGKEFMQLAQRAFADNDISVVRLESYKTDQSDLTTAVRKLVGILPLENRRQDLCSESREKASTKAWLRNNNAKRCYTKENLPPILNFEALFIPDGAERVKRIFPTLRYYNVSGLNILGTNLWDTPNFINSSTQKAAQGSFILSAFYKNKRAPQVQSFVQNFSTKYNREPDVLSAQAYDTASMVFSSMFNDMPRSSSDLVRNLKRIENFEGVTGTMQINENGDTRRKLTPLVVEGNSFKELY